jgi:glutamyl-tRNA synthetase
MGKGPAREILEAVLAAYEAIDADGWTKEAVQDVVAALAERLDLKIGPVQAPLRVAVTGRSVGPPLWESLTVLGRDRTLERIRRALIKLAPAS